MIRIAILSIILPAVMAGCAASRHASLASAIVEAAHVTALKEVHKAPSYTTALRAANMVAEDVEWWVAGDSVTLPWAGTRRGTAGIDDFSRVLGRHMRYAGFEVREYIVTPTQVAALIFAHGTARATGKPFASEVVRIYDFENGKIKRVRSFYDTGAYARAMQAN